MKKFEIKHIGRTPLKKSAYLKLLKHFSKNLKNNVYVIFDNRMSNCCATYEFDNKKKIHIIRVSPLKNKKNPFTEKNVDENTEKLQLLAATIHELRHAQQKEEKGSEFFSKKFNYTKDIKSKYLSDFYSECETDARAYENENVIQAVDLYNSYLLS